MARIYLASLLLVGGMCTAFANPASGGDASTDASAIRTQQGQIRDAVEGRAGRYKDLDEAKRSALLAHQATVRRLIADVDRTTELGESEQLQLFNALEAIEAIINSADDDRMVCKRSRPVGSHRPVTVCKTVAERRAEREAAQAGLQSCYNQPSGKCL